MIQEGQKYRYKLLCKELGWPVSTGNSRIYQMKRLSDACDWEYVKNEKTGKLTKEILIKKIRKPIEDNLRKYNGKEKYIPDDIFWTLWDSYLKKKSQDVYGVIFFGKSLLARIFLGVNSNSVMSEFIWSYKLPGSNGVLLEEIYTHLNSFCVKRIMNHYGYDKNMYTIIDYNKVRIDTPWELCEVSNEIFDEFKEKYDSIYGNYGGKKCLNGCEVSKYSLDYIQKLHPEMKLIKLYCVYYDNYPMTIDDVNIIKEGQKYIRKVLIDSIEKKYLKKLNNLLEYRRELLEDCEMDERDEQEALDIINELCGTENANFWYNIEIRKYRNILESLNIIKDDFIRDVSNPSPIDLRTRKAG